MLARWLVLCVLITAAYSELFYFEEVQRSRLADDASTCGWQYSFQTNSYEYVCEPLTETARWNEDSSPEDWGQLLRKRKWSKRRHDTNKVNFILINKGIDYKQRDRSKNIHEQVDIQGNCIMYVGHDNNCYGWSGKKDRGKQKTTSPPVQFQMPPRGPPAQYPVPPEDLAKYEIKESRHIQVSHVKYEESREKKKVIKEVEASPQIEAETNPDYPKINEEEVFPEIEAEGEQQIVPKLEEAEPVPQIKDTEAVPETQEAQSTEEVEEEDIEIKEANGFQKIDEAEADTSAQSGFRSKGKKRKNHRVKGKKRKNHIRGQKPPRDKQTYIRSFITF